MKLAKKLFVEKMEKRQETSRQRFSKVSYNRPYVGVIIFSSNNNNTTGAKSQMKNGGRRGG